MFAQESGLTPDAIDNLRRKGFTQRQIAAMYGVSDSAVSAMKRRYAKEISYRTKREIANELFPFRYIQTRFTEAGIYHRLRDHGHYMVGGEDELSYERLKNLGGFYDRLKEYDLVVEYDPSIKPNISAKYGGFAYRDREPSDGDLIIRMNKHTDITDKNRNIWTLPNKRPLE
ncbi:helix-turn-helix domain-containing protein [Haloactinomyces albus]|uniref:Transcriptional regulator with XRE-family HTH domain n=1 Tax=Haloactinomyces albus TaxID=1352928 RepID=A0AAE3ZGK4_9ACTN|nr:helix-turn-helix domain-containing protein [Haloactinomyces albus]MDR7303511.1 transcriptional regulator with XRE-family HTH domain [Haloactinomyces albus]